MIKNPSIIFLILVLAGVVICSCHEDDDSINDPSEEVKLYDMFPYSDSNEYYFKYTKEKYYDIIIGTEKWKVVAKNIYPDSILFLVERVLNANWYYFNCSTIIADTTFLEITEKKSDSSFSMFGFVVSRYQDTSKLVIERSPNTYVWYSCTFVADSGLTKYQYYHKPNQYELETLKLDSIKSSP